MVFHYTSGLTRDVLKTAEFPDITMSSILLKHVQCLHYVRPFKGILHPKINKFCHHLLTLKLLHEFLSSADHKGRYFEDRLELWHH